MPNRRKSDFPENPHIEEIIISAWVNNEAWNFHYLDFVDNENEKRKRLLEFQAKQTINNLESDKSYIKLNTENLDNEILEVWDIFIINFTKNTKNKDHTITLKFLIKFCYSIKVTWYIELIDNETKFKSSTREEILVIPIVKWWRRKIDLSIKEALFISLQQYLHESKINDITIYKKSWNKKWIKWLWNIIRLKIWNLIWRN